jgi:ketosteroid isomerase-like protein
LHTPVAGAMIASTRPEEARVSATENIETVKTMYEAFGRGDVEAILEHVTDDVDWAADAAGDAAPWWGELHGKEEATRFFSGIAGTVDVLAFEPKAFAATDDEVMTFVHYRAKVRETGTEVDMNIHHYWRFRDGKVAQYRGSEDSAQTLAALGG